MSAQFGILELGSQSLIPPKGVKQLSHGLKSAAKESYPFGMLT